MMFHPLQFCNSTDRTNLHRSAMIPGLYELYTLHKKHLFIIHHNCKILFNFLRFQFIIVSVFVNNVVDVKPLKMWCLSVPNMISKKTSADSKRSPDHPTDVIFISFTPPELHISMIMFYQEPVFSD